MKFEEVLPLLLKGKKIRKIYWSEDKYVCSRKGESSFLDQDGYIFIFGVDDFENDDWEIVKEKKKVKLRDLTEEQLEKWRRTNCIGDKCHDCIFNKVGCIYVAYCWIKDKSLFSDKFLDQEVEIEVDDD